MISKEQKERIVSEYQKHEGDTGSPEVQKLKGEVLK